MNDFSGLSMTSNQPKESPVAGLSNDFSGLSMPSKQPSKQPSAGGLMDDFAGLSMTSQPAKPAFQTSTSGFGNISAQPASPVSNVPVQPVSAPFSLPGGASDWGDFQ